MPFSNDFLDRNFRRLVEAMPVAFFVKDKDSRIVFMNDACEKQWGRSFNDLAGTDGCMVFPEDRTKSFLVADQETFAARQQVVMEEAFWNAKLKQNCIGHSFKKPLYDPSGNPLYLLCMTIDITEQKRIEEGLRASEEKLRGLYELSPLGIALTTMQGTFVEFNDAFLHICGYSRDELNSLDYWALTPKDYEAEETRQIESLMRKGSYGPYEKEYIRSDGSRIPLRLNGMLITGSDNQSYIWSIVEDITNSKNVEESARLAALIYHASSEAIMVTDEHHRIVDVNPAFVCITGYEFEQVKGQDPTILQLRLDVADVSATLSDILQGEACHQGEISGCRKNGERFAMWANISVIRRDDDNVHRYVMQFSDMTERKKKDELIWRQANFDILTNLPNRRLFCERLEQEIKRSSRTGQFVSVLFIDLDRFKEVNDTLGHHAGDLLPVEAAKRLRRCVRESDGVARLGGDEFTVILTELRDLNDIESVARRIIEEMNVPFVTGNERSYLSASVGVAVFPNDARDAENLMKCADRAMYQAKDEGRNRLAYFTESMQRKAEEKLALTNDLRHALRRGELEIYYQPIVELPSGQVVKAEALLRWQHPERGLIGPAEFIPIAEESGLILEIGEWVFNEASAIAAHWCKRFGRLIQVSVNVSPLQFADETKSKRWSERLASLGLPRKSIALEITEGMLIKEAAQVKRKLLEFRDKGIDISIDDFGTGFSSLSYLKQFEIDFLKIDRLFVQNLAEDATDKALTEAIIMMAHKLGIKTVAEGVESESQRDLLVQFGCDYAQGYLFSRPVPATMLEALLSRTVSSGAMVDEGVAA